MKLFGGTITLVAVTKMRTVEEIQQLYSLGHRDFGENYVQELLEKQLLLPRDIRWHFIGHLQSNKIKFIAPFISLIQSVDSFKLLLEINRQAQKAERVIDCLLEVHVASEETKFGLHEAELDQLIQSLTAPGTAHELANIRVTGLMAMASFSEDESKVRGEFKYLNALFDKYSTVKAPNVRFKTLSMGMSADYEVAIVEGSTMVRIGSLLFGPRDQRPGIL